MTVSAQDGTEREDFWVMAGGEASMYSYASVAWGGSLAVGYGRRSSIGLKAAWFLDSQGFNTLELCFLFRFYLLGSQEDRGPFLQFTGGPAIFFPKDDAVSLPAEYGMVSAGLNFGWRFLLGDRWFIEPFARAGYPYLAGAGISGGARF